MPVELLIVFLVIVGAGSLLSLIKTNSSPRRKWERHIRQSERDRKRMVKQ